MTTQESQSSLDGPQLWPGDWARNDEGIGQLFKKYRSPPDPQLRHTGVRQNHNFVVEAAEVDLHWTPQKDPMPPCKEWLGVSKFSSDRLIEGQRVLHLGLFNFNSPNAFKYIFWGMEFGGGVEFATFKRCVNDKKLVFREVSGSIAVNITLDPQDIAAHDRPQGSGRQTIRANLMSGKEIYSFKAEADTKVKMRELSNVILPLLVEENIATEATKVTFMMGDKLMKSNMIVKLQIKNSTVVPTDSDSSTLFRDFKEDSSSSQDSFARPKKKARLRKVTGPLPPACSDDPAGNPAIIVNDDDGPRRHCTSGYHFQPGY